MVGRSRLQRSGSVQYAAKFALSLAMLTMASVSGASVITKSYSFASDSVVITDTVVGGTTFDIITMSNCVPDDRLLGAPQLPQRAATFLIPYNEKLDSVTVFVSMAETIPGYFCPIPVQPPRDSGTEFYPPLQYLYDAGYPGDFADGPVGGALATFRTASFYLRPIMLQPEGQMVRAQQLTVYIYSSPDLLGFGGLTQMRRSEFAQEQLSQTVEAMVENPEGVTYGSPVPIEQPRSPLVISPGPSPDDNYVDCVVVSERLDSAEYQRYAEFLTKRGIVTTVRTLEWCDAQYHGADKAASVRAFVTDAYQQWGTLYAILGGWSTDPQIGLPTRLIRSDFDEGVPPWEGWATTDVYFADLEGTWDENQNGVYAEPPIAGIAAFCFSSASHGCAVAPWDNRYNLVRTFFTQNGGADWSMSTSVPSGVTNMNDMCFADDDHGWCVGYTPALLAPPGRWTLIWRTSDGGQNWHKCDSFAGELSGVHFIDADVGWAVGWYKPLDLPVSSVILHTTNGGTSWTSVQSPIAAYLYDVEFSASGQLGWITTDSDAILRTTNGGTAWSLVSVPGNAPCTRYVSFADDSTGWVAGKASFSGVNYCAVWATTDGGASWQSPVQLGASGYAGTDIQAVLTEGNPAAYDVWVTTPRQIYHRDPQGTWTLQYSYTSGPTLSLRHIQFLDADRGWAAGIWNGQGYLSTTDGGSSWQQENPEFFWGDWSAQDMMPEVLVARLPSKPQPQTDEAQAIVNKLIKYQDAPPSDHLKRVKLCTAYDLTGHDRMTQEQWYIDHGLETWKYYHPPVGDRRFDREGMLEALNTGFHFVCHYWHGALTSWRGAYGDQWVERIWSWEFDDGTINNGDMTGIAVTQGCSGLYLMADISVGRHFLTCPTGGAVAYAGCSQPNWWDAVGPDLIYYNLLKEVYDQDVTRLGSAYVAAVTPKRGAGRGRAYENLLGDPLMDIWTDVPRTFVVTHPLHIPPQPTSFTVTVLDNETQQPEGGALVCLCMYDSATGEYPLYHRQKTDPNGVAFFPLIEPRTTGEIIVTVTKHNYLPHVTTCHVGMLLTDASATYPNWGRKYVREPNTDNLHVVFTSGDTAFYSQSTDGGATWSIPESIGLGKYPAMGLNGYIGVDDMVPWVAYLTLDGSIKRAIRVAPATWEKAVVFQSVPNSTAGAPSLAPDVVAGPYPTSYAAYPVYTNAGQTINYVFFNYFTQYSVSPPEIVDVAGPLDCHGASVVVNPGSAIHVCWIRGQSVFYSQRQYSIWSMPYQISSPLLWPVTEPASNPSMEVYGDSVFCVWRGPNDYGNFPGDVWRRSRWVVDPVNFWRVPTNQSQTPDWESNFPTMTTSFATVWHENVQLQGYPDIWGRFLAGSGPQPFFESPLPSRYPHADGYWVPDVMQFKCHFAWTEMLDQLLPLYEVKFGVRSWAPTLGKGLGPEPHNGYEPSLYYAATLGQPEQSPYCLSRDGYMKFENWDVDTSTATLKYQLPYMDPRQVYKVCAVIYHEGKKSWSAAVRCDSGAWSLVKSHPGVPDTVWLKVPRRLYKHDARIVLELARVTGDYVSLAELKLFQVEDRTREDEGVQSAGTASSFVTRLRNCSPNPFARATAVNYELGNAGPVALTVHDVSGRLVRRLESGPRPAGRHVARWDGTDGRGHAVPAGVYFVRLSAGGVVSTGRLALVR